MYIVIFTVINDNDLCGFSHHISVKIFHRLCPLIVTDLFIIFVWVNFGDRLIELFLLFFLGRYRLLASCQILSLLILFIVQLLENLFIHYWLALNILLIILCDCILLDLLELHYRIRMGTLLRWFLRGTRSWIAWRLELKMMVSIRDDFRTICSWNVLLE